MTNLDDPKWPQNHDEIEAFLYAFDAAEESDDKDLIWACWQLRRDKMRSNNPDLKAITSFDGEYRFLSNFYLASVSVEDIVYPTTEHAYQAGKARTIPEVLRIAQLPTAGEAKRAGQKLALRSDWEDYKVPWMAKVLRAKFTQHADLKAKLLATEGQLLVEGNTWHDQTWGSCNCPRHIAVPGENLLGKLLMELREDLKA
jgi:ribA/ribD-fused uncharacterized protein